MSICGGCPYPFEMVLAGEAENEEKVCEYGCTFEDAAYRISWAYDQLYDRHISAMQSKGLTVLRMALPERCT